MGVVTLDTQSATREYIYEIRNTINSRVYIGRTKNVKQRKATHFRKLSRGTHENPKLQNAWDKYGDMLVFKVIDSCSSSEIANRELSWFYSYGMDDDFMYNCHFNSVGGKSLTAKGIQRNIDRLMPIIQEGYDTRLGIVKLAKKHNVSSEYIMNHIPIWEETTGIKYEHPQVRDAMDRLELYVNDVKKYGAENCKHYTKYGVSHRSIHEHLPKFGLTSKDIDPREIAKSKAINAVQFMLDTGCSALKAIKECGSSVTTFYKYNKSKLTIAN